MDSYLFEYNYIVLSSRRMGIPRNINELAEAISDSWRDRNFYLNVYVHFPIPLEIDIP